MTVRRFGAVMIACFTVFLCLGAGCGSSKDKTACGHSCSSNDDCIDGHSCLQFFHQMMCLPNGCATCGNPSKCEYGQASGADACTFTNCNNDATGS